MPKPDRSKDLLSLLEVTDRRSTGRAGEVVEVVQRDPGRFLEVFKAIGKWHIGFGRVLKNNERQAEGLQE